MKSATLAIGQNDDLGILKTICKKILKKKAGEIIHIQNKGTVNRVYLVELEDGQKIIARLNQEEHLSEFNKEKWCIGEAREIGVNTPKILATGLENTTAYMLQEYIDGVDGRENVNLEKIWYDIGRNARLIHSIKTEGFGGDMNNEGIFSDSFSHSLDRYIAYNIESLTEDDFLVRTNVFTFEQSTEIKAVFQSFQKNNFHLGLVHGDLSLKNSVIDPNGSTWIIDWGSSHAHIVPHYDFVEILRSSVVESSDEFKSFLSGYGYSVSEFSHISREVYTWMLMRAIDTARWAKDKKLEVLELKIEELKKVLVQCNLL